LSQIGKGAVVPKRRVGLFVEGAPARGMCDQEEKLDNRLVANLISFTIENAEILNAEGKVIGKDSLVLS
jgi:hypothetical protein